MEFRKCPACQASVLDDDAADCPFCGASLSGKPSAQPAAPSGGDAKSTEPAPKKPSPGKPASKSDKSRSEKRQPSKTAVAERSEPDEDEDPFDVDTSAVTQAPPVAPRPAKGRTVRIVCPMCETPGFVSPKMLGKDVKCCNKDCMVPVFKAPRPQRKAPTEPEEVSGFAAKWGAIGAAIVLPLGLLLLWVLVLQDSGPKLYVPDQRDAAQVVDRADESDTEDVDESQQDTTARPEISLAEIQQQALQGCVHAARERDENRSKPYCRRLTAEAYAQAGNLEEARRQIVLLVALTSEPYYRVEPLVELAWQHLQAGDRSEAERMIDKAFEEARNFPEVGRPAAAAVISAAAALAAVDRIDDAKEVMRRLERGDDASTSRERVAALVQITFDLEEFDLDRMLRYSSLDMVADPLAVAATVGIGAHQYWDQAIAWSLAGESAVSQEDCLSALAVVAGRHAASTGENEPISAVMEAGANLSAAGRSRLLAGAATGALMQDNPEMATANLQQAVSLFETVPRPEAWPAPEAKRIHDSGDSRNRNSLLDADAEGVRSAAVGAAQLARLQHLLGDSEAAWTTLLQAWEFTKAMGPQLEETRRLVDEIANNQPRAEQRLWRDLGISPRNQDLARRAFYQYRRQGQRWGEAAGRRFQFEVMLLREAILWGLLEEVATVIRDLEAVIPSAVGQPYRSSLLSRSLADAYAAAGNDEQSRQISDLAGGRTTASDPVSALIAQTERLFRQENYVPAAKALGDFRGRHHIEQLRDLRALQLACRMLKLKQPDTYFPFIRALQDPGLIDDCYEMTAALAVREGLASDLWERFESEHLAPTQRVAFFRGLIAGIAATPASHPLPDAQTAELSDRPDQSLASD